MATATEPTLFTPTDILTPAELAARLKVRPGWVYEQLRATRKNPLPAFHVGRFLRFSWAAVCAWIQGETPTDKKSNRSARRNGEKR